jgi:L-alanine-DL-glutamate epimerase-like enolase superfamily enzyme
MKITRVETIPVSIPIDPQRAIRGGGGAHLTSTFLLIKLHTDEGIVGLGEVSCTPGWSGEDHVTAAHLIRAYFEPLLVGQDPTEVERLSARLRKAVAGNPFTRAGLEVACWDVLGKVAQLPLYRLLGGRVRPEVPTKFSVSGLEPAVAANIAAWAVEQGFRAMKVKVGMDPDGDVARVRAVRDAVGPDVKLGVDANGGWPPRIAIQTIRRLERFDIFFAEQPVAPLDLEWMADVRRHVSVPILADESVFSVEDAMGVVRAGAADAISLYIGKGGGIGPARKTAAVAEAAGMSCTIGSNLEMDIAMAAMIHVGLATSGIDAEGLPCDILSSFFYEGNLLTEPLPIRAGAATIGDRPGLGVEIDDAKLAHFRVDA